MSTAITLFRYDDDAEEYTACIYPNCLVHQVHGIKTSGTDKTESNGIVVRIFTEDDLSVFTDGYAYIGMAAALDKENSHIISIASDNRRGINRHWRLECK